MPCETKKNRNSVKVRKKGVDIWMLALFNKLLIIHLNHFHQIPHLWCNE